MPNALESHFDGVLMLTWSDWKTEPRSNRYHYASRFARQVPVFFVQPDNDAADQQESIVAEKTELANVTIWHAGKSLLGKDALTQKGVLNDALRAAGVRRPLIWVYNVFFEPAVALFDGCFRVFHASEDYFSTDYFQNPEIFREQIRRLLGSVDLLVAVSDGVAESYRTRGGYAGPLLMLPNGCDYGFYAENLAPSRPAADDKVALFQGGISNQVDYEMLEGLVDSLPDWQFRFCGRTDESLAGWKRLKNRPNVQYLGLLPAEQVRAQCYQADVGLIPYRQTPVIVERSLPLKAYEYLACGLPVVSVPIRALERDADVFRFARDAGEFAAALRAAAGEGRRAELVAKRRAAAAQMDYEASFQRLAEYLTTALAERQVARRNLLMLYDDGSTHVTALREHLGAFKDFSRHEVYYAPATGQVACPYDLDMFDAIVIHYSVRINFEHHLSPAYAAALARCRRQKILFIQDEYDETERARRRIGELGIDVVFTCVPESQVEKVYPRKRFPNVRFVTNLTGYVPRSLETVGMTTPASRRPILIGYRGRALPYWYGDLGREKLEIGLQMRRICDARGVAVDIEWSDEHRIYGPAWYEFVRSCRAMLGTESGANVFDDTGSIKADIEKALKKKPDLGYEEAHRRFIGGEDGRVNMNQISPKIFEAIAFRTALILFEGSYSGVIRANEHYLPLKKDFSNVDEVLAQLNDAALIDAMTDRAFNDVIASGLYSYRRFLALVDGTIDSWPETGKARKFVTAVVASVDNAGYTSFDFAAPSRLMPSPVVQEGTRADAVVFIESGVDGRPTTTESYPNLVPILKSLRPEMLLRFAAVNTYQKIPARARFHLEKPLRWIRTRIGGPR